MGKRELAIILAFMLLGGIVYQVSAPPAEQGSSRSFSEILRNMRAEMFGSRARVAVDRTVTASVAADTETLDLGTLAGSVEVTGEDREDIEARLKISLFGENEGDVKGAAETLKVETQEKGGQLRLVLSHPDAWRVARGRQRMDVVMKVPRRLNVEADVLGNLAATAIAGLEIDGARGNVVVRDCTGAVTGNHRDGSLEILGARSVDVETRRVNIRLERIQDKVEVAATDGRLVTDALTVPTTVRADRVSVELDGVGGKLNLRGEDGRAQLRAITADVLIEVERMATTATFAKAVPATIEVADAPMEVTLPPDGVSLDLRSREGSLQMPEGLGEPTREGDTEVVKASHAGGGPLVKVTGTRAQVAVRLP